MATILVTAGPTREHLDDVRFLANGSTGRMGYAVAAAGRDLGHRTVLVSGPVALDPPAGVETVPVVSALDMHEAVQQRVAAADVVVGVAAVTDYRPAERIAGKPPKRTGGWSLALVANPDVIAEAARVPGRRALVGFALESPGAGGLEAAIARGREKLAAKGLDLIAVNLAGAMGADDSAVVLLFADGREQRLPRQPKAATARTLVEAGCELWRAKQ